MAVSGLSVVLFIGFWIEWLSAGSECSVLLFVCDEREQEAGVVARGDAFAAQLFEGFVKGGFGGVLVLGVVGLSVGHGWLFRRVGCRRLWVRGIGRCRRRCV